MRNRKEYELWTSVCNAGALLPLNLGHGRLTMCVWHANFLAHIVLNNLDMINLEKINRCV